MVSDEDREAIQDTRKQLAAALRLAARHNLHEAVCNHFSVMVGRSSDMFLVNPPNVHWSLMRASDLLLVGNDGQLIEGCVAPEPTSFFIHSRIHRSDPRAVCVMHTHMPYATAITVVEGGAPGAGQPDSSTRICADGVRRKL